VYSFFFLLFNQQRSIAYVVHAHGHRHTRKKPVNMLSRYPTSETRGITRSSQDYVQWVPAVPGILISPIPSFPNHTLYNASQYVSSPCKPLTQNPHRHPSASSRPATLIISLPSRPK
jgi:hypothetical protein